MKLNQKINAPKIPANHMIFYGRIGVDLQLYYSRTLLQEVFKHFKHVSNIKKRIHYYGRISANENEASFFLNDGYSFL